jgi:glycolate oxidase
VSESIQALLIEAFGDFTDVSEKTLDAARADKSGQASTTPPLAVVSPRTVQEVQEVVRFAAFHSLPIVPRGGGSGLAGGSIAQKGEIVLSTAGLNRILEISPADRMATVEAGVINSALNDEAKAHGLWFAPDPASRTWSTVGGNIATNAGGLMCAKYGVTRESVLSLDVVLANGNIVTLGHRSVKGVTGLDLAQLMIGSEGTLGIIVRATVKLLPLSAHTTWTVSARFTSIDQASTACQRVIEQGHSPSVLELIDERALALIEKHLGLPASPDGSVLVISQADGADSSEVATHLAKIFRTSGAVVEQQPEGVEAEALLDLRRAMHPAMEENGSVLIEDVAVPRSQMPEMFRRIRQIESDYSVEIPTVAHAGDGNLHPNFIYEGSEPPPVIWEAAGALFREALDLSGTLTGEHGVGLLKKRWLRDELGQEVVDLQRNIKAVFDPRNLLNPGKVFDN